MSDTEVSQSQAGTRDRFRRPLVESRIFSILLFLAALILFICWHLLAQIRAHDWTFDWIFHWKHIKDALVELPREIAVALIIAMVLNVFVDRISEKRKLEQEREFDDFLRRQQIESAQQIQKQREQALQELDQTRKQFEGLNRQGLLRAIFRENLPTAVVAQIENRLFKPNLYRTLTEVIYWLEVCHDSRLGTYVKYDVHTRYVLYNSSNAVVPHDVGAAVDVPRRLSEIAQINKLLVRNKNIGLSVTTEPDGSKWVKHRIEMQPMEKLEVVIETTGAGAESSFDVFMSTLPCEELLVNCDFDPKVLLVKAFSLHPEDLKVDTLAGRRLKSALIGVLPGQGIGLRWDPK